MDLTGHIVLITGAAGTLGRATAAAVREAGGMVVATDLTPGDGIDLTATWKHGRDLATLSGQPVRIRFSMQDCDLYSFRFQ